MVLTCKQCGKEFELADSEIEFYKKKGLELPKRCKACRDENQTRKKEQWPDSQKNGGKKNKSTAQQEDITKEGKDYPIGESTQQNNDTERKSGTAKKNSQKNKEQNTGGSEEKENQFSGKKQPDSQTEKKEKDSQSSSIQQSKDSENNNEKLSQTNNKEQNTQPPSGGTRKKGKQLVAAMVFLVLAFVVSRLTGSDPAVSGDDTDTMGQTGITVSAAPSKAENLTDSDKQEGSNKGADKETPPEIEDNIKLSPTDALDREITPVLTGTEDITPTSAVNKDISPVPTKIEGDIETPTGTVDYEATPSPVEELDSEEEKVEILYYFRRDEYLQQHFEKHGDEFDYETAEQYLEGANRVVQDPAALHKLEAEDGDDVYYLEESNEFVIVSKDGYIRTYFKPSRGIDYYNRQ